MSGAAAPLFRAPIPLHACALVCVQEREVPQQAAQPALKKVVVLYVAAAQQVAQQVRGAVVGLRQSRCGQTGGRSQLVSTDSQQTTEQSADNGHLTQHTALHCTAEHCTLRSRLT